MVLVKDDKVETNFGIKMVTQLIKSSINWEKTTRLIK